MSEQAAWRSPLAWRSRLLLGLGVILGLGLLALALVAWARWDERWVGADVRAYRLTGDPQRISLGLASCNAEHRLRVVESRTEVRVHVEKRKDTMNDCMDGLNVGLSQPLGSRKVIDAADDAVVVEEGY